MKALKLGVFSLLSSIIVFFAYPLISESEETKDVTTLETQSKNQLQDKTIIKAVEAITLISASKKKQVNARIDTGATQSSIDTRLAKELGFNKYIGKVNVISANGIKTRHIVEIEYELSGKIIRSNFTLADRSSLNYPVLIGRNDLSGFLIDPSD